MYYRNNCAWVRATPTMRIDFIIMLEKTTKELIAIPSDPDNKQALDEIFELVLSKLQNHTIERFEHNGVKSALAYNTKTRPEKFKVLLNAHLDIIPAKAEQYTPRQEGNKLYGAGAMDMKASVASFVQVFDGVADKIDYPLALQLTTDEEIGGFDGAKHQVEQGVRSDFVLAGEPTNFEIVHKAKGIFQAKVVAKGLTAHGAYPWRGDNAIWKLHDFLSEVKKRYPIPRREVWQTTVNVSRIETPNEAFNKIPDEAMVSLDIRFIAEDQETVRQNIEACLPEGCMLETIFFEPAMQTELDDVFVQKLKQCTQAVTGKPATLRGANGSSDARHFTAIGSAGVEFGPIGGGIGSDEEWVDVASLEVYCHILATFLREIQ